MIIVRVYMIYCLNDCRWQLKSHQSMFISGVSLDELLRQETESTIVWWFSCIEHDVDVLTRKLTYKKRDTNQRHNDTFTGFVASNVTDLRNQDMQSDLIRVVTCALLVVFYSNEHTLWTHNCLDNKSDDHIDWHLITKDWGQTLLHDWSQLFHWHCIVNVVTQMFVMTLFYEQHASEVAVFAWIAEHFRIMAAVSMFSCVFEEIRFFARGCLQDIQHMQSSYLFRNNLYDILMTLRARWKMVPVGRDKQFRNFITTCP